MRCKGTRSVRCKANYRYFWKGFPFCNRLILKKNDYICAIEFYKKNMAKNGDTRKLLLDIDIETMEYINDYKYAMLLSQGIVMTNVDIFIAAIQSLKRETEKEGKLKVVPRPEHVRKMEVSRREALQAGKLRKRQNKE